MRLIVNRPPIQFSTVVLGNINAVLNGVGVFNGGGVTFFSDSTFSFTGVGINGETFSVWRAEGGVIKIL